MEIVLIIFAAAVVVGVLIALNKGQKPPRGPDGGGNTGSDRDKV